MSQLYSYPKQQLRKMIDDDKFIAAMNLQDRQYYFGGAGGHKLKDLDREVIEQEESEAVVKRPKERKMSENYNGNVEITLKKQESNPPENAILNKQKVQSRSNPGGVKKYGSMSYFNQLSKKKFRITTNISLLVKKYASYLFKEFNLDKEKDRLNEQQFTQLVTDHQKIFASYFSGFHNYIWQIEDGQEPEFLSHTCWVESEAIQFIEKEHNHEHRYLRFYKNTVFVFQNRQSKIPLEIKNMEGLYVQSYEEHLHGSGFIVKHRDGIYQEKAYLFKDKFLQEQWLRHLGTFLKNSIMDFFTLQQKIGAGNFSVVYKGHEKNTNEPVAIKVIEKFKFSVNQKEVIKMQCSILELCHHPNIVKFIHRSESKTHLYIVTELMQEGDLYDYVKKKIFMDEYQAAVVMKQLCEAVIYLNSLGLIHRDLKPENIMIRTQKNKIKPFIERAKIIDFGFAVYKDNLKNLSDSEKYAGTPNFLAPEILQGEDYDEKVDNFALGVIMYYMLSGKLPFDSIFSDEITQYTIECKINLDDAHWCNVSEQAKNLLTSLLTKKDKRLSLDKALQHPWIAEMQDLKAFEGNNKRSKYV